MMYTHHQPWFVIGNLFMTDNSKIMKLITQGAPITRA